MPNGEDFVSGALLFKFTSEGEDVNFKKLEFVSMSYGGINPKVRSMDNSQNITILYKSIFSS